MKVLGLERDNTTLASSPDPLGWCYSASFELYPFHEGKDTAIYKGILNGHGPKRGEFCVVKARLDPACSLHLQDEHSPWRYLQLLVRKAQDLASGFNALVQPGAIRFMWPVMAEMDTVCDFTPLVKLFKPHDKKLRSGEMVVIEDFVEGKFQTFSSTVGWVSPDSKTDLTQAFSHYSWHATQELVICGLQGVVEGRGFVLTTPTIHSKGRSYGPNDGGLAGVKEFFSTHRCNNLCSSWAGLDIPKVKSQLDVKVHLPTSRARNRPRADCNVYKPPVATQHADYIPRVPSAPVFETTRF